MSVDLALAIIGFVGWLSAMIAAVGMMLSRNEWRRRALRDQRRRERNAELLGNPWEDRDEGQ